MIDTQGVLAPRWSRGAGEKPFQKGAARTSWSAG
jgi:hypothetical protein